MTERPAMVGDRPAAASGTGRLIAVVGPSGAGKDSLINLARRACAGDGTTVFPRRVVTRQASRFEDNTELSMEAFRHACDRGDFALHWEAHGHGYALPRAIDDELAAGRTVVANVSRTVVEALRQAYADVTVVLVTAPPEVLADRLAGRDRGSDGEIARRLGRAVDDARADVTIVNLGNIEHRAREFVDVIRARGDRTARRSGKT